MRSFERSAQQVAGADAGNECAFTSHRQRRGSAQALGRMKTAMRNLFAFLAAAVAPAAVILVPYAADLVLAETASSDPHAWERFNRVAVLVAGTSLLYVVVLGIPAFLLLHWRKAIRWWSATAVGFFLGCLPVAFSLWPADADLQTTASHWDGEKMVQTVVDGVPTLAGWVSYAKAVAGMGAFGAVGGLAFWVVWRAMRPNKPMHATYEDARA